MLLLLYFYKCGFALLKRSKTLNITHMKKIILIFIFSSIYLFSFSQRQCMSEEQREKIKAEKIKFIIEDLQLTESEKTNFIPLYKEYNKKLNKLHKAKKQKFREYKKNSLNMSDQELLKTADAIVNTEIKMAELKKEYLEKYKKILPAQKILLLYKAEQRFKKHLLKIMKGKCPNQ